MGKNKNIIPDIYDPISYIKYLDKKILKLIAKLFLSLIIILYLLFDGSLNLQQTIYAGYDAKLFIYFFILTLLQLYTASFRTHSLLMCNGKSKNDLSNIFHISWATLFINCYMPISIVGEIIKIKELSNLKISKVGDSAFYATIYSKLFSILALLIIVAISSLFVSSLPNSINALVKGIYILLFITILAFIFKKHIKIIINIFSNHLTRFFTSKYINTRILNFKSYNFKILDNYKVNIECLIYSIIIQLLNSISLVLIIAKLHPNLSVTYVNLLCVIPIGMFISTLPIFFLGLGIGNIAFQKLLYIYNITDGANIFMLFFGYSYVFNLIGLFSLILITKKKYVHQKVLAS